MRLSTIFQTAEPPSKLEPMERLALPRGEIARQFTKLMLSLLSHIGMESWWAATVTLRAPPFKRRLHRCNACDPKKIRREGGVEPPQPGL
jgi:hypothetical protein